MSKKTHVSYRKQPRFENLEDRRLMASDVAPTTLSITPSSSTAEIERETLLTGRFADANGYQDIRLAEFRVADSYFSAPRCLVRYDQKLNVLKLHTGSSWLDAGAPGSGKTVHTSTCSVNAKASSVSVINSKTIDVTMAVTFHADIAGDRNLWLRGFDNQNFWGVATDRGNITVDRETFVETVKTQSALVKALNGAVPGSRIRIPAGTTITLSAPIRVPKGATLEGPGTLKFNGSSRNGFSGVAVQVTGANAVVRDIKIQGPTHGNSYGGIWVEAPNVLIDNVTVNDFRRKNLGYGILVDGDSKNLRIVNSEFNRNRHAVSFAAGATKITNALVQNNVINNHTDAGLDAHYGASGIKLLYNTINFGPLTNEEAADGIAMQATSNFQIIGNVINGFKGRSGRHGILIQFVAGQAKKDVSGIIKGNKINNLGIKGSAAQIGIFLDLDRVQSKRSKLPVNVRVESNRVTFYSSTKSNRTLLYQSHTGSDPAPVKSTAIPLKTYK